MRIDEVIKDDKLGVPTPSLAELVKKHGVPEPTLAKQLAKGIETELEHTEDRALAKEIALDHIAEMPDYYDKLENMEKDKQLYES